MRLKLILKLTMALLCVSPAAQLSSQVGPSAQRDGGLPIAIGAGYSSYNADWGYDRMGGVTVWADWNPHLPWFLNGLGAEAEARDTYLDPPKPQVPNFREATIGGGPIYKWRHYRNFHPYAKYLISYGSVDFAPSTAKYNSETRTITAAGGGVEYRLYRHLWVRGDYEYQTWNRLGPHESSRYPQGFTAGLLYDFKHERSRKQY